MTDTAECQVCKEVKKKCCAFHGHYKTGEGKYCYCKDCCPWKLEHAKDNILTTKGGNKLTIEERLQYLENEVQDIKYRYQMRDDIDE